MQAARLTLPPNRQTSDTASGWARANIRDHVPSSYDSRHAVPLVLALHGRLGQGSGEERLSHFDKISDERGFLVAYPDGLDRSWADGRGGTPSDRKGVDDVKFLLSLIDQMEREFKVDPRGFMQRACRMAGL